MAEQDQKEKEIVELKKKVTTMFQAMQRMERLLKQTERKASRAADLSRKSAMEVTQLKALLIRRE